MKSNSAEVRAASGGSAPGGAASGQVPYPRFLAEALGILVALAAVGTLPTLNLAGGAAIPAMLAGCGLALVASLAGTVPIARVRGRGQDQLVTAFLGALAVRLTVAGVLAAAAALSGLFAPAPLLVWMLVAHLGLLVADTRFALSLSRPPAAGRLSGTRNGGPLEPALEKR